VLSFTGPIDENVSEEEEEKLLAEAVEAAREADLVVMPLGEHYAQSGEAASRAMIDIPEVQMRLLREVSKVNANIVVVLFNGRPLDLREVQKLAKAILVAWFPGTEGGHAILDVLTGKVNPSGKLPMSFPYCVGQVPVHYNEYATGRPEFPERKEKFRSRYLDIPNTPLYPFGYGLSYTQFSVSPVRMDGEKLTAGTQLTASATVKNTGDVEGTEVLQLYIRDQAASVVRPVKELKGFSKVTLLPGEEKEVSFVIDEPMLRFTRADGTEGSEPGRFTLWIGTDSTTGNQIEFVLE
jgi:beta-glucosidase